MDILLGNVKSKRTASLKEIQKVSNPAKIYERGHNPLAYLLLDSISETEIYGNI